MRSVRSSVDCRSERGNGTLWLMTASPNPDVVLCDIADGIATLTFNRPERNNGWTDALGRRYLGLLKSCNEDPNVRAIVVTGAGKAFCPGADLNMLSDMGAQQDAPRSAKPQGDMIAADKVPSYLAAIIGKPVIAAVNGACAGLGLVHAMLCDVRFAARGAKFTMAFSQRGLIAEYGSAWLLPRLVGRANALDLLLSSRVIQSDEAKALGLVNFVSEPDQLLDEARAYAYDMAAKCSPQSLAIMKRQVLAADGQSLPEAVTQAGEIMNWSVRKPDFKEGVASYLAKRPPEFPAFTGRTGDPHEV